MTEQQAQQTAGAGSSNKKWIALGLGGGCALVACLGLVAVLAFTFLAPRLAGPWTQFLPGLAGSPQPTELANTVLPGSAEYPQEDGNKLGDPSAPVKIVEYADFQCPFCLRYSQETEPKIIETYVKTGKVYYEYRSVGAFIGPESAAAAEAAYCAGDQGRFWEYHATLFSHWTGENAGDFARDKLLTYAAAVGLDPTAFYDCLANGKYAGKVAQDAKDAQADGVHATPSFLVNGKLIEGALPFDAFQKAIEDALQGK